MSEYVTQQIKIDRLGHKLIYFIFPEALLSAQFWCKMFEIEHCILRLG